MNDTPANLSGRHALHFGVVSGGAATPHALRAGSGILEALSCTAGRLAEAEVSLLAEFESDIAALGAQRAGSANWDDGELHALAAELHGETPQQCRVLALVAYRLAAHGTQAETAVALARRALRLGHLAHSPIQSPQLLAAGLALSLADRYAEAEDAFSVMATPAVRASAPAIYAVALGYRAAARFHRGALEDAAADLEAALDAERGQPWETMVCDGRGLLLRVYLEKGQVGLAEAALERWCATGPLPDTPFGHSLRMERGRVHLARGRFAAAAGDLESAGCHLEADGSAFLSDWRSAAAIARHHLGEPAAGLALARADLALAKRWGAPRRLGLALTTLGLVECRHTGIRHLRKAVNVLEESPSRLQLAQSKVALGATLRRVGKASAGRASLRAGLELATSISAFALADETEQELAASGISRSKRAMLSGPTALTPSEARVAKLAAAGKSNPDIAGTLYITRKTVEMHLLNTYRKLDIKSRHQLGEALGA